MAVTSKHSRGSGFWPHRCTLAVALAVGIELGACAPQPGGVELLEVNAVVPAEAQFGDAVQVIGDGFGLGNPATVTFRGDVYRAGQPPEALHVSFRARTESPRELALTLAREAESAFCGGSDEAAHATFRGDIEVSIAARAPGAPPATGLLHGAVVELYPAVKSRGSADRLVERGGQVLAFLGIDVAGAPDGGLEVLRVDDGGRAAAAELLPGDRLLRAGGVTVLQPSDLLPPAARELELTVLRGDTELGLRVDVDGFTARPPSELGWAALPIFAAVLGFAASASPLSRLLGWAGQNWVEQQRAQRRSLRRAAAAGVRGFEGPSWLELMGGASGLLVWLGLAAALSAPLLRRTPVDVTSGLVVALFASTALLAASSLIDGGAAGGTWSFRRALLAAGQRCVTSAPAWIAGLAPCFENGIELDDAARAQGAWPWTWNAFANPGFSLALLVLLLTCVPRPARPGRLAHARPSRLSWRQDGDGWFDRAYLCSACALATVLFLGGDALHGVEPASASPWAVLVAAAWVVAKYTLLVLAISFLRGLFLGITPAQWSALSLRYGLPAALVALSLTQLWRFLLASSPFWSWVALGYGPASAAVVAVGLALLLVRSQRAAREPGPPSLSLWL
jgi:NADH-quinone oxidoreductase subunit H